jgi:hypothetical protein
MSCNIIILNIQQTNIQMFHNVSDLQPTTNKIIFCLKKVCACECFDTCVLECVKNFFYIIKSLLIREGHAKVLFDKALMWGKDCKKNKNKNEETKNLENPKSHKKYAYTVEPPYKV